MLIVVRDVNLVLATVEEAHQQHHQEHHQEHHQRKVHLLDQHHHHQRTVEVHHHAHLVSVKANGVIVELVILIAVRDVKLVLAAAVEEVHHQHHHHQRKVHPHQPVQEVQEVTLLRPVIMIQLVDTEAVEPFSKIPTWLLPCQRNT